MRPGVDAQKYNPELTWTEAEPDPKIGQLNDKLRHMRQVSFRENLYCSRGEHSKDVGAAWCRRTEIQRSTTLADVDRGEASTSDPQWIIQLNDKLRHMIQ